MLNKKDLRFESNNLYDSFIDTLGESPLDAPSEELAEIVDCIAHGLYGLKDRGIEVILKKKYTQGEEKTDNACICYPVTDDNRELICDTLRLMYVTYKLTLKE